MSDFKKDFTQVLLEKELNQKASGTGAIIIFNKKKTNPYKLMKKWVDFFHHGNCDKCTPCREGVYRVKELLSQKELDLKTLEDLVFALENTSLCALGKGMSIPFKSLIRKVLKTGFYEN